MNIYLRRAIRNYKPDGISDDIIKELINAGTYAPSALDEQPWRFVVIKNKVLIKKLSDIAKQLWQKNIKDTINEEVKEIMTVVSDPDFNIFYNAPVLILIFSRPGADSPEIDCALAAENMMLAARSLDIGSCWIGLGSSLGSDKEVLKEIGVPLDHTLMSQLIFGYPADKEIKAPDRIKDVVLNWVS